MGAKFLTVYPRNLRSEYGSRGFFFITELARMEPIVRVVSSDDAELASELVQLSFLELAAGDWEPYARQRLCCSKAERQSAPCLISAKL
jgi:hypothetical protein